VIRKAAAGIVVFGALYFLLFGGEYTFLDLWRLDRAHEREVAELEAIRVEVTQLQEIADSLATDSAALERLAREQYGLIREGERLYRFVEPDTIDNR
jgi:cell division protein FtsB